MTPIVPGIGNLLGNPLYLVTVTFWETVPSDIEDGTRFSGRLLTYAAVGRDSVRNKVPTTNLAKKTSNIG